MEIFLKPNSLEFVGVLLRCTLFVTEAAFMFEQSSLVGCNCMLSRDGDMLNKQSVYCKSRLPRLNVKLKVCK